MMTLDETMQALSEFGNEQTKKVLLRHGAKEPFFGVKVQDLKKLQKKIKKNQALAAELMETGNGDAMYLAGLISEPPKMEKDELRQWAEKANWYMLSECPIAWVASESRFGWELGMEWINDEKENLASAGWSTLSSVLAISPNEALPLPEIEQLLETVDSTIHQAQNRVRYTMNNFVISVGSYVPSLLEKSKATAERIGKVSVDVGKTACKVPLATKYIAKIEAMGRVGKKRKTAFC